MGFYYTTLPCGCEMVTKTLEYPTSTSTRKRCEQHKPQYGNLIRYNIGYFLQKYGKIDGKYIEKDSSFDYYIDACVRQGPVEYFKDDCCWCNNVKLMVKLPDNITLSPECYQENKCIPVGNEGDVVIEVPYFDWYVD